jgi:tetratricopeptide (TPR) repeat protein
MDTIGTPSRTEVHQQLEKIFSTDAFDGAPTRRSLLEYIVVFSLNGEEKGGKEIAPVIFPLSDPDSTNVRVNVSFVRDMLATYYADKGSQDLVKIDLPIGRTYKASFSYKFNVVAVNYYKRGVALAGGAGHMARLQAKQCFDHAILHDSTLAAAHIAKFELTICDRLINLALARRLVNVNAEFRRPLDGELESLESNPGSWYAWTLHGIARLIGGRRQEAEQAFEKALVLDAARTTRNMCYGFYLLLNGDREKALEAAMSWEASFIDERMYIVRALFFYLAGIGPSAIRAIEVPRVLAPEMITITVLLQGLTYLESTCYGPHYFLRSLYMACSDWEKAIDMPSGFTEEEKHLFSPAHSCDARMNTLDCDQPFWTGYAGPDFSLLPGFNIFALARVAKPNSFHHAEALELLRQLEKRERNSDNVRPLQLAIAYLGFGEKQKAVKFLRKALVHGDDLVWHLDYLPLFKELKGYAPFDRLQKTIALWSE